MLARPTAEISLLDVVDAIEGPKSVFECREIRRDCVLYRNSSPKSATRGVCAIHAAMLDAEQALRDALARRTLAGIAETVAKKLPGEIRIATRDWFDERASSRPRQQRKERHT